MALSLHRVSGTIGLLAREPQQPQLRAAHHHTCVLFPASPAAAARSGSSSSSNSSSSLLIGRAGFGAGGEPGGGTKEQESVSYNPAPSVDTAEALENRIRNRRAKKANANQPKADVNAPVVDAVSGQGPLSPQAQAETNFVSALGIFFYLIIIEGLVVAGSGFLPEDWDDFVQNSLYPSYTPTVLLFLGFSSLYGLWKTGKLSLPWLGQATPPPPEGK